MYIVKYLLFIFLQFNYMIEKSKVRNDEQKQRKFDMKKKRKYTDKVQEIRKLNCL